MATLKLVHDELSRIAAEMRSVLDNKAGLSPGEVEERYEKLNARATELEASATNEARMRRADQLVEASTRKAPAPVQSTESRRLTATPEYRDAFWRYLSSGNASEVRAITQSSTNIGLPDDMYRTLVERLYTPTNLLGRMSRLSVDGDKQIPIANALPTAAFVADNSSISASDPTFSATKTLNPKKLVCRTTASVEALADAVGNPDMQGFIMKQQAIAMQILLEQAVVRGGVSGAWTDGLTMAPADASQTVAVTGAYSAITGDDLIDAVHKVPPQYRTGNFVWLLHDTALKTIRKIKVASGNADYVWKTGTAEDLTRGVPGTIYGIPYIVCQSISNTETTEARIVVGNLDYALLVERQGMQMLVDPYSGSSTLAVNLYTYARFDYVTTVDEAFAGITFSTAN